MMSVATEEPYPSEICRKQVLGKGEMIKCNQSNHSHVMIPISLWRQSRLRRALRDAAKGELRVVSHECEFTPVPSETFKPPRDFDARDST